MSSESGSRCRFHHESTPTVALLLLTAALASWQAVTGSEVNCKAFDAGDIYVGSYPDGEVVVRDCVVAAATFTLRYTAGGKGVKFINVTATAGSSIIAFGDPSNGDVFPATGIYLHIIDSRILGGTEVGVLKSATTADLSAMSVVVERSEITANVSVASVFVSTGSARNISISISSSNITVQQSRLDVADDHYAGSIAGSSVMNSTITVDRQSMISVVASDGNAYGVPSFV